MTGLTSSKKMRSYWSESSEGYEDGEGTGASLLRGKAGEEKGTLEMPLNICRVGVRRMGPDSSQWCPVTGQGAMGTN